MSKDNPLVNIDLKGLSKPLTKLVETVGAGCGVLYEPTRIKRKAKAEAVATEIMAEADAKKQEIAQRAAHRFQDTEIRRQENVEAITAKAYTLLDEDKNTVVSEEPVSEDWVHRFYDECKDIGEEEAQKLWGKVLAEEVKNPNSFSPRTLHTLKNMSRKEAETFTSLCSFVFEIPASGSKNHIVPIVLEPNDSLLTTRGLNYMILKDLDAIGLINFDSLAGTSFKKVNQIIIMYFGKKFFLHAPQPSDLSAGKVSFTPVGRELYKLTEPIPDDAILKKVLDDLEKANWNIQDLNTTLSTDK
ncbi:MAG: hypothetical protein CL565_02900 [Alphaproteobacteria bacterium]|nr:hypothetical protein [Alphaproteobacteria bacterium]|tara:strand:- start:784 stop:1686 length:903 start_codon:yes stop_codon:yes gene_type:complete